MIMLCGLYVGTNFGNPKENGYSMSDVRCRAVHFFLLASMEKVCRIKEHWYVLTYGNTILIS